MTRLRGLVWIPALVGLALACAAVDEGSGIRKWLRLRSDLRASEARIAALRGEIHRLENESAALEADAFAIERAIREDLDLARAGETLVRLDPPPPPGPTGAEGAKGWIP